MNSIRLSLLTLIFSTFFLNLNAQVKSTKVDLQKVDFISATRGNQTKITIDKKHIKVVKTGQVSDSKSYLVTKADWVAVRNMVQQLDLKKINQLKAPSSKNHSDGAMASHFEITTANKTYSSVTFDNYDSPEQLIPLLKKVVSLAKLRK